MSDLPSIRDLVPHAEPMLLLDAVISTRELGLTAAVTIRSDSLFAEADGVPAWAGLEYIGQAIAAFAGIDARRNAAPVRIGFLVSTRRYDPVISHFPIGTTLEIAVDALTDNTTGLRAFECTIRDSQRELVTANLNVFMPENLEIFMAAASDEN